MPTTLVASILMLHRKGISEDELEGKVRWLGQDLTQRGILISTTEGLPSENTLKIGLKHLGEFIRRKRDMIHPLISPSTNEYNNLLMLGYYRNALNFIFYNEGVIVVSIMTFGQDKAWSG